MSLTWAAGATLVLACWAVGTLFTVAGRRQAAVLFAGDSPGFTRTARAQLTGTALNRVLPANGGLVATHLRLLKQHGVPATEMTAALMGYAASHLLAHISAGVLVFLVMWVDLVPGDVAMSAPHLSWMPLLALGLLLIPKIRRLLSDAARIALRRPGAVVSLALFELATLVMLGLGLFVAVQTSGSGMSLPVALCVLVVCNVLAGAVPAPGGAGPVDLALVGALTAFGVTAPVAAVAMYRLVTHWLPVPLGLLAVGRPRIPLATRRSAESLV